MRGPVDTLFVAGGEGVAARGARRCDDRLDPAHGRARAAHGRVCSGAFLLAQAGLLDGRRATTHWRSCAALARAVPARDVEPDRIYVRDGRIATSAGITAGMDLALALLEDDLGGELARDVARQLVLFLRRPGGQSQFSVALAAPAREPPDAARAPDLDPRASRGGSRRRGARAADGDEPAQLRARSSPASSRATPARYVERARVEAARRWLEDSAAGLDEVASACGFGSAETLRRAFLRLLRVSPSAYRERIRAREFSKGATGMTTIGLLIFDGAEELDFVGPWEVFTMAGKIRDDLRVVTIAERAGPVACAKGMRVLPDHTLADAPALDVVLVPGGQGTRREVDNPVLIDWLRRIAPGLRWVTSVCTGALLLCEAGLARGRRVTTHWAFIEDLRKRYPDVEVLDRRALRARRGPLHRGRRLGGHRSRALADRAALRRRHRAQDAARHGVRSGAAVRSGGVGKVG